MKIVIQPQTKKETPMKNNQQPGTLVISVFVLIAFMLFMGNLLSPKQSPALAGAEFLVSWFDVSEEVLDGLKGVELVNSGYHGSMETTAVLYDPAIINVEQIKNVLKDTGIYLGTIEWSTPSGYLFYNGQLTLKLFVWHTLASLTILSW